MEYNLTNITPDIRKLNDMKAVVCDQKWLKTAQDSELYYMYRGLEKKDELRYDVTIIPAKMLGNEFNKTKGHYHVGAYQEIYTVLEGSAIYLMQKLVEPEDPENISDVYAIKAEKGDSIIIPSYYGHVTINPSGTQDLKMANWVSNDCKSDYSPFEKMHGACYYYTKNGWIKNKNYKAIPELRFEPPAKSLPQNLDFLKQK